MEHTLLGPYISVNNKYLKMISTVEKNPWKLCARKGENPESWHLTLANRRQCKRKVVGHPDMSDVLATMSDVLAQNVGHNVRGNELEI